MGSTVNDSERKRYCDLTSEQLSAISVPDAVHCANVNCSDPAHIEETTRFYIAILGSLQDASSSVFQLAGNGQRWRGLVKATAARIA